ncbi:thiol-disulfide oxidoreductase DCC family protein [Paenibacillus abyssi]|uniref:Membrane protein n=1 Tax=Paenibacillus abyssi TaxID=1340531 RepID=A0A917CVW4_9BACL|nr:thiol-disulfide oxidoreductase DCC family protein [Paenibacillus abyssi]GGF98444.1 membrane protein [Paenibacillus abyssi]
MGGKFIVLFDGMCNFCNNSVQFIMKRDPKQKFQFASLQSSIGRELVQKYNVAGIDSFLLIEGERCYIKSTAALRVCRNLKGLWKLAAALQIVPRAVRDRVYDWFARNRIRWFGASDSCMLPTPEQRKRFL